MKKLNSVIGIAIAFLLFACSEPGDTISASLVPDGESLDNGHIPLYTPFISTHFEEDGRGNVEFSIIVETDDRIFIETVPSQHCIDIPCTQSCRFNVYPSDNDKSRDGIDLEEWLANYDEGLSRKPIGTASVHELYTFEIPFVDEENLRVYETDESAIKILGGAHPEINGRVQLHQGTIHRPGVGED